MSAAPAVLAIVAFTDQTEAWSWYGAAYAPLFRGEAVVPGLESLLDAWGHYVWGLSAQEWAFARTRCL